MRRWLKVLAALLVGAIVLLVLNAVVLSSETKRAEVTVDGAELIGTSTGTVQVLEEGNPAGTPIVLIHCYACSLHWWDGLAPLLAVDHRVIRVELLGHGGSDKPSSGYAMEEQAAAVAEALAELNVSGATVVGHSLGATVATALAVQSPELVARLVNIDQAPDSSYGELGLVARLGYYPVIGQGMQRLVDVVPDSVVRDQYEQAFAPGFSFAEGFEDPEQPVEDLRAMTYASYDESAQAEDDYTDEEPLDQRLADSGIPLLVIFGAEEQIYDPQASLEAFSEVPGVRTATIEGAGHSPNVERPEEVAALILEFAADEGDEAESPLPPRQSGEQRG